MKKILTTILIVLSICLVQYAWARVSLDTDYKPEYSPAVKLGETSADVPSNFANLILQILAGGLLYLAAPVAILIIAIAGLIAVISHGNQALTEKAKKTLVSAIIGLLVIIFSWIIVKGILDLVLQTDNNQRPATSASQDATTPASNETGTPTQSGGTGADTGESG
jgi:hypothetical protein